MGSEFAFCIGDEADYYEYEDKITRLSKEEFFDFFNSIGAQPEYEGNNIRLLELCHKGKDHAALFYTDSLKVTCFGGCNTMMLHNWVKRALDLDCAPQAKELIENWIKRRKVDLSGRSSNLFDGFDVERDCRFVREHIEPLPALPQSTIDRLYEGFITEPERYEECSWHRKDGIDIDQLLRFQIAGCKEHNSIIIPHHNIKGEIVGIIERHFNPTKRELKEDLIDVGIEPWDTYRYTKDAPSAKYLPLPRPEWDQGEGKSYSYSFPTGSNLYGLHLAKDAIAETGKAIIFEGGKSVMLAHQYGYPYAVASHTFGCGDKHINMLLDCGAKEIILAFDRQYKQYGDDSIEFKIYEKKTTEFAEKIKDYVKVSRIIDTGNLLDYKDAPIDKGKEVFDELFNAREPLTGDECELIF